MKSKMLWEEIIDSPAVIMAQTAEFDALFRLPFSGTILDPVIAEKAMSQDASYHAWVAVQRVVDTIPRGIEVTATQLREYALKAMKEYRAELGVALRDAVTGSHFTFVDPTLQDPKAIVEEARSLAACFGARGLSTEQLVVSIHATEAGIQAAKMLQVTGSRICTNLTHVSGLIHAAICVEAGAIAITFCCEPMLVAHKALYKTGMDKVRPRDHPCIQEIQATVECFKVNKIPSKIMVNSFCGTPSIEPLKGIHCVALRSAEINEVLECGTPFTAPLADSIPYLRARQAQYPLRYMASRRGYISRMSAATRSMAVTTLFESRKEMSDAWRQMVTFLSTEINESVQTRDAGFEGLTRLYEDDTEATSWLIALRTAGDLVRMKAAMSSKRRPRRDDLGFRMCTITWGGPPIRLDLEALIDCDEVISTDKTTPTSAPPRISTALDGDTGTIGEHLLSDTSRNTHNSGLAQSSNSGAKRGGVDKNSTRGRHSEEEEVF